MKHARLLPDIAENQICTEVGDAIGLGRQRVIQLERKAVRRLWQLGIRGRGKPALARAEARKP